MVIPCNTPFSKKPINCILKENNNNNNNNNNNMLGRQVTIYVKYLLEGPRMIN